MRAQSIISPCSLPNVIHGTTPSATPVSRSIVDEHDRDSHSANRATASKSDRFSLLKRIKAKLYAHPFVLNDYPSSLPQRLQRLVVHLAPDQHHLQPRPPAHSLHQLRAHIHLAASYSRACASSVNAVRARGGGAMDCEMEDEDPLKVREEGVRKRGERAEDRHACGVAAVQAQGLYRWQRGKQRLPLLRIRLVPTVEGAIDCGLWRDGEVLDTCGAEVPAQARKKEE